MTPQLLAGDASGWRLAWCVHHVRAGLLRLGLLALLVLGPSASSAARAWDNFGHMVVAAVAWQHLTPAARSQATALLRLNPDYPRWVEGITPANQDVMAFLRAATWADALKREAGYVDDSPVAPRDSGYGDRDEHRSWHYVDVPFSPDGTALPAIPAPNAATRIEDFRHELADTSVPAAIRSYDLVWLEHLVGDLHQRLHAVSRFTQELPAGDLGGARERLCEPPCRVSLHHFWDAALGFGTATQALALAGHLPTPAARRIQDSRIAQWLDESGRIARRVVYYSPIGPGAGPYPPTRAYLERSRVIARDQVALAGRRLAVLLNKTLLPPQ